MQLYEIDNEIMDCVDAETGEIVDADKLTALMMARDAKIEGVALWLKNLKAEAAAIAEEKKAFTEREKALKSRIESVTNWLDGVLDGTPFETAKVKIGFRKSEKVEINNLDVFMDWARETLHPEDYLRFKDPEPDKDAIKKALKNGINVFGCSIMPNRTIQIK